MCDISYHFIGVNMVLWYFNIDINEIIFFIDYNIIGYTFFLSIIYHEKSVKKIL